MTAPSLDPAPSLASLPRVGVRHRLLFLFLRRPAFVLAVCASALMVIGMAGGLALHQLGDTRAGWGVYHVASSLALAGLAAGALAVGGNRAAGPRLIAAALRTATPEERPHLHAELARRLGSPVCREPVTWAELAAMFNSVREEHGVRARRMRERLGIALARQQGLLEEAGRG